MSRGRAEEGQRGRAEEGQRGRAEEGQRGRAEEGQRRRAGSVVVDTVGPDDWRDWRELRLEALQQAPQAFCRTHAEALAMTEADWRALLARPGGWWLVRREARPLAMAGAWREQDAAWLGAVYVTSAARGRGLLDALVRAACGWARDRGADALLLEVHEDNAPARAAYGRLGFRETGARRAYPLGSGEELTMRLPLAPAAALPAPCGVG